MDKGQTDRFPLAPLAWATALLPLVAMHGCYLLSASEALVPWCLPWFEGCTSISRAARSGTAYFVFKGLMLPACVLMVLFWLGNRYWLRQQGGEPRVWWWLGMVAAVMLGLYTVVLGHIGETFHLLRRIGVTGFFGLTYLAQLGLSAALRQVDPLWGTRLLGLSALTLLVGISSVVLDAVWPAWHDSLEDGYEWSLAVLINLHTLVVAWLWQRSSFAIRVARESG